MVMSGFYSDQRQRSPFAGMVRLAELNRLQQNFPYADDRHYMFVATLQEPNDTEENEVVVGFVDVDNRPATRKQDAPRPYLSDLVVHPNYRRRGIALRMVRHVEGVVQHRMGLPLLYIRVERDNQAARRIYLHKLQYQPIPHPVFGVDNDTTVLLRKDFVPEPYSV